MDLSQGEVSLDGIAMAHLDPADLRRDVGLLAQYARLFHGTLRENLTLGAGQASDQELVAALAATGALEFVRHLPKGLDHLILEGGQGLSGGQRQALVLRACWCVNRRCYCSTSPRPRSTTSPNASCWITSTASARAAPW
jgi:ABC-type bacteriocin/lantibiotic exporters, contain an N-terminal double-glycine peptidase domain